MPTGSVVSARMACASRVASPRSPAERRRGNHGDAFLVGAADFRRPGREAYFGDRGQRHRPFRAGIHDEVANFFDRRRARIDAAHQHVDLLLLQAVTRRDTAAHVRHYAVGDVAHREAELRGAFLVEEDLDLGMAAFDAGTNVAECSGALHAIANGVGRERQALQVVAREDDFHGGREREQGGAREFVLRAGDARELFAQLLHGELFAVVIDGRLELHVEIAGVLARVDRIGIQPVASARDRIGAVEIGQLARRVVDVLHLPVGGFQRRTCRQPHLHGEFTLRELRDEFGAEPGKDQRGGGEQAEGGEQHRGTTCQRPVEQGG